MAENEKALALDPSSPQINGNHAAILIDLHHYDDALAELNKLILANPEFPNFYGNRALVYFHTGNEEAFVADVAMEMKKMGAQTGQKRSRLDTRRRS